MDVEPYLKETIKVDGSIREMLQVLGDATDVITAAQKILTPKQLLVFELFFRNCWSQTDIANVFDVAQVTIAETIWTSCLKIRQHFEA